MPSPSGLRSTLGREGDDASEGDECADASTALASPARSSCGPSLVRSEAGGSAGAVVENGAVCKQLSPYECGCSGFETDCSHFSDELIEPFHFTRSAAPLHPFAETAKLVQHFLSILAGHIEPGFHKVDPFEVEFLCAWEPLRLENRLWGDRDQTLFCILSVFDE
jgi:hypothetical protein